MMLRNNQHCLIWCLLALACSVLPAVAVQAEDNLKNSIQAGLDQRQEIQRILDTLAAEPQVESVRANRQKVKGYVSEINGQIRAAQAERDRLQIALKGIDEKQGAEQTAAGGTLAELIARKNQKEAELARLRLALMTAEEAVKQLDMYLKRQEARDNYFRAEPLWQTFKTLQLQQPLFEKTTVKTIPKTHGPLLFLALFTAVFVVISLIPIVRDYVKETSALNNAVHQLIEYLTNASSLKKFIVGLVVSLTILIALMLPIFMGINFFSISVLIVFFYFVIRILIQVTILRFKPAEADGTHRLPLAYGGKAILSVFCFTSAVLIVFSSLNNPFQLQYGISVLFGSLLFLLWLVMLFLSVRYSCHALKPVLWRYVKPLLLVAVIFLSVLEFFGYRNFTGHLTLVFGYTVTVLGLALFLYDAIDPIVELLERGKDRLIDRLAIEPVEKSQGMKTLKILCLGLKAYVLFGVLILVLLTWGIIDSDFDSLKELFLQGSNFGGFSISPARITLALLLFVLLWPAIEYLKQFIDLKWLSAAEMSKSTRETFITVSGYLCYGTVILVALAVAGVKLTGLTVIIGALSVGIGFGLQNIVNNFISGLILIFERPIKKGDWILVGTTEGYVKRISIRSTIVQTFDRSDVIVPNSELISNQVTNMMFEDQRGRLRVSIGVAYGSDTALVQRLLLEIANAHEQVITDGSTPEPRAWFQAFGDSSLNFDLLCHLKDVDQRIRVRSELHMAIDQAFREHEIEIPFPQRDIHIKNTKAE